MGIHLVGNFRKRTDNDIFRFYMACHDNAQHHKKHFRKTHSRKRGLRALKNDKKRGMKIISCCDYMRFNLHTSGRQSLDAAYFCKDFICPICQNRKAMVQFKDLIKVHQEAVDMMKSPWHIVLTTAPSHQGLEHQRKKLWDGWNKLRRQKPLKDMLEGFFCSFEVTWSKEHDWLCHLHIYAVMDGNKMPLRLEKNEWEKLLSELSQRWKKITGDSEIVGLKNIRNVFQFAKYIMKPQQLDDLPDDQFFELMRVMKGKRMSTSGGICKEIRNDITQRELIEEGEEDMAEGRIDKEKDPVIAHTHWKWKGGSYEIEVTDQMQREKVMFKEENRFKKKSHSPGGY